MSTLIELASQIVTAQTSSAAMSTEDILSSLTRIHCTLGQLEAGAIPDPGKETVGHGITVEKAFKKNEVVCMICGKAFKTLGVHLSITHGIKAKEYRKRFGLPKNQCLSSKVYHDGLKGRADNLLVGRKAKGEQVVANTSPQVTNTETAAPVKARKVGRPRKTATAETQM